MVEGEEDLVVVVGGGLAGCLAGLLLARDGRRVEVYELRSDPRKSSNAGPQRSINLALSTRGLTALALAGLDASLREIGVPMYSRCLHQPSGSIEYQSYGQRGQFLVSVSRSKLNSMLLDALDSEPRAKIVFGAKCIAVDLQRTSVTFEMSDSTSSTHTVHPSFVIGADGTFSRVRSTMARAPCFDVSQAYIPAGYKELSIPISNGHNFHRNSLHIWPRGKYMLIALPNLDGSLTCTLFMDFNGKESFEQLQTSKEVTAFFSRNFPDALDAMPSLVDDFQRNPTPPLVTIRCAPYHDLQSGRTVLIGDAAHAIVPFFGQGINAGFEDCRILLQLLKEHNYDLSQALPAFSKTRKPNADAIAQLALQNYEEMASHTASPWFLWSRRVGLLVNRLAPGLFVPLYSLVSFSNTPYAEAVALAAQRKRSVRTALGVAGATLATTAVAIVASAATAAWIRRSSSRS